MVSVPCATTTPSAPSLQADNTDERIWSQCAGVSCELSTAIRSTTSTSSPAVRSAPLRVGRLTPLSSLLVAMVPPVVTTTKRPMGEIIAKAVSCDDGGVTDESPGTAEPATDAGAPPQPAQKRLRLLLTVAGVVLILDIV